MNAVLSELCLHVVVVGNLLAWLGIVHLGARILFMLLAIAYVAVVGSVAMLFSTSLLLVPFNAIKLQLKFLSLLISYAIRGFKPLFPKWTLIFELAIFMMRFVLQEFSHVIVHKNAHQIRGLVHWYGETILASSCKEHATVPEKLVVNEMEHLWLRDPHKKQHHVVVIHLHGGGFCISDPLLNAELGNQTHATLKQILRQKYHLDVSVDVLLVRYRMAPEFVYPTAVNDCFDMYMHVLKYEDVDPSHVVLSGDSIGAAMSIAICMRLRKEDPGLQPAVVLSYSPVVAFSLQSGDEKAPFCLLPTTFTNICISVYLRDVTDPKTRHLASLVNNNLRDLPPIFMQWGCLERFYEQGLRFKATTKSQGVTNMKFDFVPNMVHGVVMFPPSICPTVEKCIGNACAFAAKHLAQLLRVDPESEP